MHVKLFKQDEALLHCAIAEANEALVTFLLLREDVNINGTNQHRETPLYLASELGHEKIVQRLLNAGAAVDRTDCHGASPLYAAVSAGHTEIVRVLLEAGADPNCSNNKGVTPLYLAARAGHEIILSQLLDAGADVNKKERSKESKKWQVQGPPLYIAAVMGYFNIVKRLLRHKDIQINQVGKDGKTALFAAAEYGHFEIVQLLLPVAYQVFSRRRFR